METGGSVIVSSSQSFDLINTTAKINPFAIVEERFKWTSEEIARLIHIIVRPILIVAGTNGNCLSFYIMRRTSLKDVSSCFYMSLLALADTSKYALTHFQIRKLAVRVYAKYFDLLKVDQVGHYI